MKPNALAMLSAMNEQQANQLMAATLLAISVIMKKTGLKEIEVGPDDYKLITPGETLEPIPRVDGGFIYRFTEVTPPLAKRATPKAMKGTPTKGPRKRK